MKISLYFYSIPQYLKCLPVIHEADYIYLPYQYFKSGSTNSKGKIVYMAGPDDTVAYNAEELNKEKYVMAFPYVLKGNTKDILTKTLWEEKRYTGSFLLQNLGDIPFIRNVHKNRKPLIHGDYGLNIQNIETLNTLYAMGFDSLTLSPELNIEKMLSLIEYAENDFLIKEKYIEIVGYGRIVLMRSAHCYISDENGYKCGKCQKGDLYALKDKEGAVYPVLCNPSDCESILLGSLPIMIKHNEFLSKMRKARSCILRLNILNEEAGDVSALIKYFKYGLESNEINGMKYANN